jgi:hypothetical protein
MIQSELGKLTTIPESTFANDMQQLVNNKLFADVIFILPNSNISQQSNKLRSQNGSGQYPNKDVIYAHKAILISRSEYFKVMFLPTAARENPEILKSLTNWMGSLSLDDNKQLPAVVIKDITFQYHFSLFLFFLFHALQEREREKRLKHYENVMEFVCLFVCLFPFKWFLFHLISFFFSLVFSLFNFVFENVFCNYTIFIHVDSEWNRIEWKYSE